MPTKKTISANAWMVRVSCRRKCKIKKRILFGAFALRSCHWWQWHSSCVELCWGISFIKLLFLPTFSWVRLQQRPFNATAAEMGRGGLNARFDTQFVLVFFLLFILRHLLRGNCKPTKWDVDCLFHFYFGCFSAPKHQECEGVCFRVGKCLADALASNH